MLVRIDFSGQGSRVAGDHERGAFAHVRHAIGDTLQVVRGPEQMRRTFNRAGVLDHERKQFAVNLLVEIVHIVVLVADLTSCFQIVIDERLQAPVQHAGRDFGHAWDVDQGLERRLISRR
jgi:hypothetical protein